MYSIYGIEESDTSKKPLLYDLLLKDNQLCNENYFYCVFIIYKGSDHIMKTLNKSML